MEKPSSRGSILRGFGLKVGATTQRTFGARILELVAGRTMRGVGALLALTYVRRSTIRGRFASSRRVGAHVGLTPKRYQSGETDVSGRISKIGDAGAPGAVHPPRAVAITQQWKIERRISATG